MPDPPAPHSPGTTMQAFFSAASVVGVVVLVVLLLMAGVYAVVFLDLMPQLQ
ncbi:MAG: hypothetical protein WAM92_09245 [Mycobacterium sp.]